MSAAGWVLEALDVQETLMDIVYIETSIVSHATALPSWTHFTLPQQLWPEYNTC